MHSNYIYQEHTPRALILCNCRKNCATSSFPYIPGCTHTKCFVPLSQNFSPQILICLHICRIQIPLWISHVLVVLTVTPEDSGQVQIPCTRTHPALVSYWKVTTSWMTSKATHGLFALYLNQHKVFI